MKSKKYNDNQTPLSQQQIQNVTNIYSLSPNKNIKQTNHHVNSLFHHGNNGESFSPIKPPKSNFANPYISQSPQPLNTHKAKNLMVYGINSSNGKQGQKGEMQASLNIKSQKDILQAVVHANNQLQNQSVKPTTDMVHINKEKERIHQLLSNTQVKDRILIPSSRNQKEDAKQQIINVYNHGQPIINSFKLHHNSFQVQPSNIHELNSFLNSNHYQNSSEQLEDKRKVIKKKIPPYKDLSRSPDDKNGLSSAAKSRIKSASKAMGDEVQTTNIETDYKHLMKGNEGISKLVNSPPRTKAIFQQIHNTFNPSNNIELKGSIDQKKSFDFSLKQRLMVDRAEREDINNDEKITNNNYSSQPDQKQQTSVGNHSFLDKKSNKQWILMNSRHIKNRSEVKTSSGGGANIKNLNNTNITSILKLKKTNDSNQQSQENEQTQSQILQYRGIVEKYAQKTRMGFIPNTKKTNQDNMLAVKDLAGIQGLWMFGVMDGHGINGHLVSDFVKKNLPQVLSSIIRGGTGYEPANSNHALYNGENNEKKKAGKSNNRNSFLPPLVNQTRKAGALTSHQASTQQTDSDQMVNGNGDDNQKQQNSNWFFQSNQSQRDQQIKESFRIVQDKLENSSKIDSMFSGTTCVIVFMQKNQLLAANSGDSRAILITNLSGNNWTYTQMSRDHKPEEADEAARVRKCNGRIEQSRLMSGMAGISPLASMLPAGQPMFFGPKRVWLKHKQVPGLAMTRSLGDVVAKSVGVTYEPEIKVFSNLTRNDKVVVIASDGIWDRLSNDEIVRFIVPYYERKDPDGAAQMLIKESAERWQKEQGMIDDISIMIIFLNVLNDELQQDGMTQQQNGMKIGQASMVIQNKPSGDNHDDI